MSPMGDPFWLSQAPPVGPWCLHNRANQLTHLQSIRYMEASTLLLDTINNFVFHARQFLSFRQKHRNNTDFVSLLAQTQTELFSIMLLINKLSNSTLGDQMYRLIDEGHTDWEDEIWNAYTAHNYPPS